LDVQPLCHTPRSHRRPTTVEAWYGAISAGVLQLRPIYSYRYGCAVTPEAFG